MTHSRTIRPAAPPRVPCPICHAGVVADYDTEGVPIYRDCMFCHGLGTVDPDHISTCWSCGQETNLPAPLPDLSRQFVISRPHGATGRVVAYGTGQFPLVELPDGCQRVNRRDLIPIPNDRGEH